MTDPGQDGAITAEERGDSSVSRSALTRTLMVVATVALVAGIVLAGNALAGNGLTPWVAASSIPAPESTASPAPSDAQAPAGLAGAAGGTTATQDAAARTAASTSAAIVAAVDGWLAVVSQLAWDDPRALTDYGTVILSARAEPYGLGDLIARGAVRQDDATTFSLVRPVVVRSGARLQIDAPGTTLRLLSTETGFTELVGWGGTIALNGAEGAPFVVTSWDDAVGAVDADPSDGRGFVLVRNGRFESSFTRYEQLGFWSGRTGGVAVTATDLGLASAALSHTEHIDLAFGVFLSGVVDSAVSSATIIRSALSGVEVTSGSSGVTINDVTVDGAERDGVTVERGSRNVTIADAHVTHSARFGVRISGDALASGPNPSGETTTLAEGFTLSGVTASDNGSGGIAVDSGNTVLIDDVTVTGVSTALAIRGEAHTVSVTNATLTSSRSIPLVIEGDITDAIVADSTITGSSVGVRIDDARVALTGNVVTIDEGNAIQLAGTAHTRVTGNTINGIGQDAVQVTADAHAVVTENDTAGWDFRPEALQWLNHHPMAWLWLLILVIPAAGMPFIVARRREHRELRTLLEGAIVRYGLSQLAEYGTKDAVAADAGGSAAAARRAAAEALAPADTAPDSRAAQDAAERATMFRAELAARGGQSGPQGTLSGQGRPAPGSTSPRRLPAPVVAAPSPAASRPAIASQRPPATTGHPPAPSGPRSLQDLRALLAGRDFASMQQFAVAAVLEAGYPVSSIARLFRVPAWRIEQWVEETLTEPPKPQRLYRGR